MRLFIRLQTASGSRTIISSDLTARDASECLSALAAVGIESSVHAEATPVDMKALLKRRARADRRARAKSAAPDNLVFIRKGAAK